MSEKAKLYIVLSQTGTIFARIIKLFTRAQFNHCSIGFSPDLRYMFSFARRYTYFPFWAGYVAEGLHKGTYKRFPNSNLMVLELAVDEEQYQAILQRCEEMYRNRQQYHYNILGLCYAAFKRPLPRRNHYYCSEFVREMLVQHHVIDSQFFQPMVEPAHFMNLPGAKIIFCGILKDYLIQ